VAPIQGVISARLSQNGERVGLDARILEIVDLSRLELEAALSASDSLALQIGQLAALQVEGVAKPLRARVVRINPTATAGSRQVVAYLALEPQAGLRQGLFAQGTLAISKVNGVAIPSTAIRTDKPKPYVQVIQNNQVAHVSVELGARGEFEGTDYVIVTGLSDQTTVLRGHVGALREGVSTQERPERAAATSGKGS
jgi:hypothetical protein